MTSVRLRWLGRERARVDAVQLNDPKKSSAKRDHGDQCNWQLCARFFLFFLNRLSWRCDLRWRHYKRSIHSRLLGRGTTSVLQQSPCLFVFRIEVKRFDQDDFRRLAVFLLFILAAGLFQQHTRVVQIVLNLRGKVLLGHIAAHCTTKTKKWMSLIA